MARYGAKQARAAEKAADVSGELDAVRNRAADGEQFERYRKVLGDEAPRDLAEFQRVKYNEAEKWEDLKGFYRYKKSYPSGNLRFYHADKELHEAGVNQGVLIPAEPVRAYILPDGKRDPWHITKRMAERQIGDDDLRGYMENARGMLVQWGGRRRRYMADNGMCVISYRAEKTDWVFKTAWTEKDFDEESLKILEVFEKYGL